MTQINLLPWRELKREQEKKMFTSMLLLGLLAAAGVVILFNYYATSLIDYQMARNERLRTEINVLNGQIEEIKKLKEVRAALISRMTVVQNLQSTRTLTVHLFDELIRVMPAGVYITKIDRVGDLVNVWGYSESNTNISMLMRSIEKNAWIQAPTLTEIKKTTEVTEAVESEFKLSFILKAKSLDDKAL